MVDGLTNGKTYTCTVAATNAEGTSAASAASAAAVPGLVPTAPAQPTVTHGNASISVAFSAPASNGGSVITGYTATCTSSDGGTAGSSSGATSPVVVSALTNGNTYTCTVFASNANGAGNPSVASASTVPATTPGTPAQPTLTHGNASISVVFSAPAGNGGSAITGYTATCTSSDGGTAGSSSGATSPVVVSALDERQDLHLRRAGDERRGQRKQLRRVGFDHSRDGSERAGPADDLAQRHDDDGDVRRAGNRWERDHRLHRELCLFERRHRRIERRRVVADSGHESFARQDLQLHRSRDQRRGQRHGIVRFTRGNDPGRRSRRARAADRDTCQHIDLGRVRGAG